MLREKSKPLLNTVNLGLKYQLGLVKWKHCTFGDKRFGLKVVSIVTTARDINDTSHALVFYSVKLC